MEGENKIISTFIVLTCVFLVTTQNIPLSFLISAISTILVMPIVSDTE